MKKSSSLLRLGGAFAFAVALIGCDESGTEPIFNAQENQPSIQSSSSRNNTVYSSSSVNATIYDDELEYNYDLLDLYYLYAHKNEGLSKTAELEDYSRYYNGSILITDDWSACTQSFGKVCNMYSQMSDNFTRYFDPLYAEIIMNDLTTTDDIVGIGAIVREDSIDDSTSVLIVDVVYENGPSEAAGLNIGDTIIAIDGIEPNSYSNFVKLTNGNVGDSIDVKVRREDTEKELKITISTYKEPTVHLSFRDSVPVIRITEYVASSNNENGTYGEFLNALKKVIKDYKSAIIDLRGNGGGDVDQCNSVSAELLSKGDTIIIDIETDIDSVGYGRNVEYIQKLDTIPYTVETDGLGKDLYYVFLADNKSASCAELMLSAVTVNKKSPVVGQVSYGKGIGQYVFETYARGLALITGLRSMDKNKEVYHKVGIVPDYKIEDKDEQMAKAVELIKKANTGSPEYRTAGYGTESTGNFAKARAKAQSTKAPASRRDFYEILSGAYKLKTR